MKTSSIIAIALAAFVGVLGATELSKWLEHRAATNTTYSVPHELLATNVDYQPVSGGPTDFRAAAKKALPSVVAIDRFEEVQRFWDRDTTIEETGSGSGVIIASDGTIVTNNHVVTGAREVRVRLADHRTFTAEVVGTDPTSDLAVIRVKADGLTPIEMGDSDKLDVGQWVLAIGNPLGFEGTLSAGIVSNKSRSLGTQASLLINAIQTDAPINPGNSGGALTDADGRLIGINAAIGTNTGGNIGIGFAIPVNRVKRVAREIIETGHAHNPYVGLYLNPRMEDWLGTSSDRDRLARTIGVDTSVVPSHGYLLYSGSPDPVAPGSPADRAGVRPLDVLLAVDGKPVNDRIDYFTALDGKRPGDTLQLKFWSKGSVKTVNVTLTEEPVNS
ncbi:MAG TPA: trypsin-like peptidase domain-containing protein [Fimbriimonadaceae bacterium]|nr:trypsin-like peptidase domain-containing protein [Fimbriimonadaceae bacterium]